MKNKKVLLLIISFVILLSITGILYVYYLFNKTSHLPEHIPANANLVIYFNTQVLIKKSLSQETDTSQLRELKEALQNSPYFKGIKDPRDLGIDVFSGAALVNAYDLFYLIIPLNDAEKFTDYFEQRKTVFPKHETSLNSNKVVQYQLYGSANNEVNIAFNSAYAILYQGKKNIGAIALDQILNVAAENSFTTSTHFKQACNDSAGIWFYADKKYVYADSDIKGIIRLKKGIHIEASDLNANTLLKVEPTDLELPLNSIYTAKNDNKQYPLYRYMNQLGMLCRLGDDDDGFISFDFSRYNCLMTFDGPKTIQTESVSYEYDDNFNKRAVKTQHTDTIESCELIYRGAMNGQFSNTGHIDTTLFKQVDQSYRTYVTMDESILQYIAPLPVKFQLKAWHRQIQSVGYYYFDLKIKALPKWQF
jgi:hypothetical protein